MTTWYVVNDNSPTAVFSTQFLFLPPPGFSVESDGCETRITQHNPKRVWRLTGEITATGGLIGRWPD